MKKFLISDTHNDFLTELGIDEIPKYIAHCKQQNVKSICSSYWTSKKRKDEIKKQLPLRAQLLFGSDYLLHIEDLWWVQNEEDLKFLIELSPFSCSLTWNNLNELAGGAKSDGKLTTWGRHVLNALLSEGIVVDTAHLNRKSFFEAVEIIKNNIFCSHTGFFDVCRSSRNLSSKQIDIIVESEGFVGLFFFDQCVKFMQRKDFLVDDIVQNLQYFTSLWGSNHIGIGSDFFGIETYPKGLEEYCDFANLASALISAGWKQMQIENVFSSNFQRFLEARNEGKRT